VKQDHGAKKVGSIGGDWPDILMEPNCGSTMKWLSKEVFMGKNSREMRNTHWRRGPCSRVDSVMKGCSASLRRGPAFRGDNGEKR